MSKIAVFAESPGRFEFWKAQAHAGPEAVYACWSNSVPLEGLEFVSIVLFGDWKRAFMSETSAESRLAFVRSRLRIRRGANSEDADQVVPSALADYRAGFALEAEPAPEPEGVAPTVASAVHALLQERGVEVALPVHEVQALGRMAAEVDVMEQAGRPVADERAFLGYHVAYLARRYGTRLGREPDYPEPPLAWPFNVARHISEQMLNAELRAHYSDSYANVTLTTRINALFYARRHDHALVTRHPRTQDYRSQMLEIGAGLQRERNTIQAAMAMPRIITTSPVSGFGDSAVASVQRQQPDAGRLITMRAQAMERLWREHLEIMQRDSARAQRTTRPRPPFPGTGDAGE